MADNTDTDLPPMTATEDKVVPTKRAYDENLVSDAQREAKAMAAEGLNHPSTKPILKGAAIGAVAGLVLPLIGPIIGAAAGGSYMFYKRLRP